MANTNILNNQVTALSAARPGIVMASTVGVLSALIDSNTAGQVLISSASVAPAWATITSSGGSITFTPGSNTLNMEAAGVGGMAWTRVVGTTESIAVTNGYVSTNGSLTTLTLPATAALGAEVQVVGEGAGGWKIATPTGQNIQFGSLVTTTTTGSLSSSNRYDSVVLICRVADTTWAVTSAIGVLAVV